MARKDRVKARKGNAITVNFKGVEGRTLLPEGSYEVRVTEVTQEEGQNAPYLRWKFEVTEGKMSGKTCYNNTSLAPNALWNLKNLLEATGADVPDDEMDLELSDLVGAELRIHVEHEDYEGRPQVRVTAYEPLDSEASAEKEDDELEEEDGDDEPAPSKSARKSRKERRAEKKAKKKPELSEDDVEDMDEEALEALVEEHDLDVDLDSARTLTKKKNLVLEALEDAGILAVAA